MYKKFILLVIFINLIFGLFQFSNVFANIDDNFKNKVVPILEKVQGSSIKKLNYVLRKLDIFLVKIDKKIISGQINYLHKKEQLLYLREKIKIIKNKKQKVEKKILNLSEKDIKFFLKNYDKIYSNYKKFPDKQKVLEYMKNKIINKTSKLENKINYIGPDGKKVKYDDTRGKMRNVGGFNIKCSGKFPLKKKVGEPSTRACFSPNSYDICRSVTGVGQMYAPKGMCYNGGRELNVGGGLKFYRYGDNTKICLINGKLIYYNKNKCLIKGGSYVSIKDISKDKGNYNAMKNKKLIPTIMNKDHTECKYGNNWYMIGEAFDIPDIGCQTNIKKGCRVGQREYFKCTKNGLLKSNEDILIDEAEESEKS